VDIFVGTCQGSACACGVAAREGNEIIMIDKYQRRYPIVTPLNIAGAVIHIDAPGADFLVISLYIYSFYIRDIILYKI
jgi:hypothetical protein